MAEIQSTIATVDAESFLTEVEDARLEHAAQGNSPQMQETACTCGGVNVLGVGICGHTLKCPACRHTLPALDKAPVHNALHRMLREELLSELISATTRMAEQLMPRRSEFHGARIHYVDHCCSCGARSEERNKIVHLAICNVGRALAIIQDLQSNPKEKEVEAPEQGSGADDATHPRENFNEPWKIAAVDPRRENILLRAGEGPGAQIFGISGTFPDAIDYMRRAVACVNFCRHLGEPEMKAITFYRKIFPDEPEAAGQAVTA